MDAAPLPLTRRDLAIALALAALVLVAGRFRMAPGVCGTFHDDAIYVSTAEALAAGQGYRLIGVPGQPLQTKYPILYPALLSAVWRACPSFPGNLATMQWLTLSCAAAAVALSYLYLVRFDYFSRPAAACAGLVCATASYFLYFGVQPMAEMPFALLSIVALWRLDGVLVRPHTSRLALVGLGACLALPFMCRTIGVTLVVAGLGVLWRRGRPVRWPLAGVIAVALPWVLWSLAGRGVWNENRVDGYYTDYFGCWSSTGVEMTGRVLYWNSLMVLHGSAQQVFQGLAMVSRLWVGNGLTWPALMLIGVTPWLAMIPDLRRGRALPWALAAYLAVMLVWSWPPYRFLVPILPCLAAYLLSVPAALLSRLPCEATRQRACAAAVCVVVAANAGLLASHAIQSFCSGYPLPAITDTRVAWSSYERVFGWVRENSQPTDVLASGLDSMVALYTDRQAFRPLVYDPAQLFYLPHGAASGSGENLAAILRARKPRFLIQTPMPGFAEEQSLAQAIDELKQQHPLWLKVVYQDSDPRFVVYEVRGER